MMYPLVRELAARDASIRVPVAVCCRVLNFSRQAYYQWVARPIFHLASRGRIFIDDNEDYRR